MSRNPPPRNDRFEDYVPVAERLEKFYERFPDGRVITHIIEHNSETGFVLMRAEVYRNADDAQPAATGHAFEVRGESYVNKTSYVENCETGACGRALALLGFEVKRGIASREELEKTARMTPDKATGAKSGGAPPDARNKRRGYIERIEALWQEEVSLGGVRPREENDIKLEALKDDQLLELGQKIAARVKQLKESNAVAAPR